MNKKQIIGHLMAATGVSVSVVAKKNGYTRQAFYDVISGRTKSPQLRSTIATIINKPENAIWPEPAKEGK